VGYGGRADAELVAEAQAGAAPAFAVLLHRHGPAVRSAVRHDPDPTGAVLETFVRAMRELRGRDPAAPVRPWLLELAGTGLEPDPLIPLSEEERDEIWAELAVRWPTGRVPRRRSARRQRMALAAGLVAVSALVPAMVLLAGQPSQEPLDELRAFPLQTAGAVVAEPEEPEPLPSITFPTVPELEQPPSTEPAPAVTTTPQPAPTATTPPAPVTSPSPRPTPAPAPAPAPTSSPEPTEPPAEPTPTEEPEPLPAPPIEPPDPDGGGGEPEGPGA
jgi:hypothetical protein